MFVVNGCYSNADFICHNYPDIILILAEQMVAETVLCPNHPESDNIISTTHVFPTGTYYFSN